MNFESFAENISNPKIIFESEAELLADAENVEMSVLNEGKNFLEFELLEIEDGNQYRISRSDSHWFMSTLLQILVEKYPDIPWKTAVSLAGDESEPASIYIDYKLLSVDDRE